MPDVSEREELRHRVEAKRKELESRLEELKADVKGSSREEADSIRTQLDELQGYLSRGWESLTERTAGKLNEWLGG